MNAAGAAAIVYGVLAIAGGIVGYLKTQSKASIISGGISGVILTVAGIAVLQGQVWGLALAAATAALLTIFFAIRYSKTRKVMPSGLMTILGAICLVVMVTQR